MHATDLDTPTPVPAARPRLLFVDDDRLVRTAYLRQLQSRFDVVTAQHGEEALALAEAGPAFTAVFTDFQMPGIDGVQLLARLRTLAPDTVRVLFTGKADLHTMAAAVNEGEIFRVLLKPCATAQLWNCVDAVLAKHAAGLGLSRVASAATSTTQATEASVCAAAEPHTGPADTVAIVRALSALLARTNPPLAQRQQRLRAYVHHMGESLGLPEGDTAEQAALLSGLALLTLDAAAIDRLGSNQPDDADERARFAAAWAVSAEMLRVLPGLDDVAAMIEGAAHPSSAATAIDALTPTQRGAALLRTAWQLDVAIRRGDSLEDALHALRTQGRAPARLVLALADVQPQGRAWVVEEREVADLEVGMTLEQPVRAQGGLTLAPAGQVITPALLRALHGYLGHAGPSSRLAVRVPVAHA